MHSYWLQLFVIIFVSMSQAVPRVKFPQKFELQDIEKLFQLWQADSTYDYNNVKILMKQDGSDSNTFSSNTVQVQTEFNGTTLQKWVLDFFFGKALK